MAFYDRIEQELAVDEFWGTKLSQKYESGVRDIWEVKPPEAPRDSTFHVLHWSYRSLWKSRYLRRFAR
ncbi:hypothetical protein NIES2135_00270 [Leptolyngbya boryana NIES-2135]|jgi:hypothetical protein|uniref:Uncharacterized protein n=1 Tax=Leptolyngbya boryana NIES-2135 TaxID=1973484 RepID=A0A1Z4J8Y2_LEPBY|nr:MULTISPECIES: hypothetical protein [Leptolyngbya]BAY53225.1 hypothetical protein NIES2135_00270 [Leptolyngbya boryana NIES-2135]MBD2371269.1 hypothetical protein [Leptolyngbya sp. FACHB-161]MBD2377747.1 hypothetical protein [Leptolyngbya sp. FACHB-238]MBD2402158.1 hypothetical protein [Leptolyngbya sp. FACHB-239]MBD2408678.1 hypothetical protein [Leptolyngbya sp. FACHB-402]